MDETAALLGEAKQSAWEIIKPWLLVLFCFMWVLFGVLALDYLEGWPALTSLYVIMQIVTTIGYGDVTVTNQSGKLFCCWYVVGTILILGALLTEAAAKLMRMNEEFFRIQLRRLERRMCSSVDTEEEAAQRFGQTNEALVSFVLFATLAIVGALFFRLYEHCSCSYGVTLIEGCEEGPRCMATGGAVNTWTDAVYTSLITLTTVGFGDHSPKTVLGRSLSIVWMLLGVVATANFASAAGQLIFTHRRHYRCLKHLSKDVFEAIDTDHDGKLTRHEFRHYALIKYELCSQQDLDDIDRIFDTLDRRKAGEVSLEDITSNLDQKPVSKLRTHARAITASARIKRGKSSLGTAYEATSSSNAGGLGP